MLGELPAVVHRPGTRSRCSRESWPVYCVKDVSGFFEGGIAERRRYVRLPAVARASWAHRRWARERVRGMNESPVGDEW